MVHLYLGTGKGKTTAACGLALRAAGSGKKVYIAQFLKGKEISSGLIKAFSRTDLPVVLERFADQTHPFFKKKEKDRSSKKVIESTSSALKKIADYLKNKEYDLIVCDELLNSLESGFSTLDQIRELVTNAGSCELIFTGRTAPQELIDMADYVSNIEKVKHPFDKGTKAREGIEY